MKKLMICMLLSVAGMLFADETQERMEEYGLSTELATKLIDEKKVVDLSPKGKKALTYFVKSAYMSDQISAMMTKFGAKISVENLYYLPDQQGASRVDAFNNMLKFSTLTGLQRNDTSSQKNVPYIIGASSIAGPVSTMGQADQTVSELPKQYTTYVRQTDEVFGQVDYQVDMYTQSDEICMTWLNVADFKQKANPFASFANKGGYMMVMFYIPLDPGKGSLLYTAILLRKEPMSFSRAALGQGLSEALDAYKQWFVGNYNK
jgi:hypothetical protein